ncbi:sigma-70 family RNA polymerase sigma factor [Bacillus carboniphilus]|uniref:Sigma-70 family RNA polymerase sigma factor n=1 Tax=Bacillus carboniphilus TaxID=86663 RepID=A0ABY9JT12_9BACI|nr:sigma-70 family RNA polymerase sigma factor [Bacillus carboniphilus]WLR41638.1 sigma-70 family RNA polymerase sigma factor [Bacillus carboniphilus]
MEESIRNKGQVNKDETLEWLMNEYGQSITRLAYTYTKQKQLAEDIAQEVFIKCYQNLDQFRQESSYKTWLYRITVNLCKDKVKSWSFRNLIFTDLFSTWTKTTESPETRLIDIEDNRYISEKVLGLPIKYREIVILFYYEEFSYSEISEMLDLKASTVKSRLHRGRILLKRQMEEGVVNGRYV